MREICEALSISRSGYYAAVRRQSRPSKRRRRAAELYEHVKQVFYQNRRCYSSPRVTRQLRTQGQCCSENRVARLMHNGLKARQKRCFRPRTTDSGQRTVNRAKPSGSVAHRENRGPQSGVGQRYHLHPNGPRMALLGCTHGPQEPKDRRLVPAGSHAHLLDRKNPAASFTTTSATTRAFFSL